MGMQNRCHPVHGYAGFAPGQTIADPADDGQRDPLAAPGQPIGVLALVQEDGRTTSARYLGEDGEIRELPAEDVAAMRRRD